MGQACDETYVEFLESIKAAGITISNEAALRERLAETGRWRFAFMTLARHGQALGIRFQPLAEMSRFDNIRGAFARYQFPADADKVFADGLARQ